MAIRGHVLCNLTDTKINECCLYYCLKQYYAAVITVNSTKQYGAVYYR